MCSKVPDAYDHLQSVANLCSLKITYDLKDNLQLIYQGKVLIPVPDGHYSSTCMTNEVSSVGCAVAENQMCGSDALQSDGLSSQKATQVNHEPILCKSFINA